MGGWLRAQFDGMIGAYIRTIGVGESCKRRRIYAHSVCVFRCVAPKHILEITLVPVLFVHIFIHIYMLHMDNVCVRYFKQKVFTI